MPKWTEALYQILEDLVEADPNLAWSINSTANFLKKHPLSGDLVLKPNTRCYTDPNGQFRISYEIENDDILITVIHLL